MTVKEALLEIDGLRPGEKLSYRALAKKTQLFSFNVDAPTQGPSSPA
jgi:hypothetical protein